MCKSNWEWHSDFRAGGRSVQRLSEWNLAAYYMVCWFSVTLFQGVLIVQFVIAVALYVHYVQGEDIHVANFFYLLFYIVVCIVFCNSSSTWYVVDTHNTGVLRLQFARSLQSLIWGRTGFQPLQIESGCCVVWIFLCCRCGTGVHHTFFSSECKDGVRSYYLFLFATNEALYT